MNKSLSTKYKPPLCNEHLQQTQSYCAQTRKDVCRSCLDTGKYHQGGTFLIF